MIESFSAPLFLGKIDENALCQNELTHENFGFCEYHPKTVFVFAISKTDGIFLKMTSFEKNPRAVCEKNDENCYEDSCMEFFLKPFSDDPRYINIEMTPKGVFLSQIGENRFDRVLLKSQTDVMPSVKAEVLFDRWSVTLNISNDVISKAFKREFIPKKGVLRANLFKCGDKTPHPHYLSFSKMGSFDKGFHDSNLFAKINII